MFIFKNETFDILCNSEILITIYELRSIRMESVGPGKHQLIIIKTKTNKIGSLLFLPIRSQRTNKGKPTGSSSSTLRIGCL